MQASDPWARYALRGKTAIVTGGSSGIGRAIAFDFARFGARVVVVARGSDESIAAEMLAGGAEALYVRADVSDADDARRIANTARRQFGGIDVLVNCAAIASGTKLVDLGEGDWDRLMGVNLKGVFLCCRAIAPHLIERKAGAIVNIGSASSRGPVLNTPQGGADYCVSKSGVHALTRALAWELAPHGITVNTVAPGPVDTPWHRNNIDVIKEKYTPKIPLGRLAEPQDIANTVMFLASSAGSYITGQAIHVNGGMLMAD